MFSTRFAFGPLSLIICVLLTSCGPERQGQVAGDDVSPNATSSIFDQRDADESLGEADAADLAVLFFGNSHTYMHDVPGMVGGLLKAAAPDKTSFTYARTGGQLSDINKSQQNHELMQEHSWDVVVLQGQEISSSGNYTYSLDPAIKMAESAAKSGARVLLFAEWATTGGSWKREDIDERTYIEDIYRQVAEKSAATVVPIGQAFELALAERPDLILHDFDGNHSSPAGAYLAACMIYGAIASQNPDEITDERSEDVGAEVSAADRKFLREIAAKTLEANAAK